MMALRSRIAILLLLAGPVGAQQPGSPYYIPPPNFADVDFDDVIERVLKGIWKAQPIGQPLTFEITGQRPHHFKLRVLTHPYCKVLHIDRYALTVEVDQPEDAHNPPLISMAEIKFDGNRKKTNCLSMPAWITFHFASPPNYEGAKVTIREQLVEGPDENEYEMIHE
jgi:hypothetical protein